MPRRAAQSSAPLVQTAAGNPLPLPCAVQVVALTVPDAAGVQAWTGLPGVAFRVLDFWVEKTNGAGGAGDTLQLRTAAGVAITDALSLNVADQAVVRAAAIDDAQHAIAAGGGLQVNVVDANGGLTDLSAVAYALIALT